jgi:hypothetical protein
MIFCQWSAFFLFQLLDYLIHGCIGGLTPEISVIFLPILLDPNNCPHIGDPLWGRDNHQKSSYLLCFQIVIQPLQTAKNGYCSRFKFFNKEIIEEWA